MGESGRLSERDYYSVRDEYESDQTLLDEWCDDEETLVAVVSCPRETGIDEMCDEHWSELGMPEKALTRFWEHRAGYRTNSAVDRPHNKAYEDCDLEEVYREYIRNSDEAQARLTEIIERLESGENITLVCFEESGKHCHRHALLEIVSEHQSCQFDLSPKA